MNIQFREIKILIWDFDGTLYKPNPRLWHEVREGEYRVIREHTGWAREKTISEFERLHSADTPSATEAVAQLSHISVAQAAGEMEEYFDRRKFVKRDEKLIQLFRKLKKFRHVTLANGVKQKHIETLRVLGVAPETFELMVTSEIVGVTKPHDNGFRYILAHTKMPPAQHLMIGDRVAVDLVPAKALGMKTCLVWGESTLADISLSTVYDVAGLLL